MTLYEEEETPERTSRSHSISLCLSLPLSISSHVYKRSHGGQREKVTICRPGSQLSAETKSASTLILNSWLPDGEKKEARVWGLF